VVPPEKVSFFTSLITPLALLNSRNSSVLAASREVLGQLRVLNPQSVLPLYLQGALAEREGDLSGALASYEETLAQDPSCYPAEIGAARVSIVLGQTSQAVDYLVRLNLRFPEDRELTGLLGEGYYQQGAYEAALEAAAAGLTLWPDDGALLFLRARVLERLGRYDTARRLLTVVEGKIPPGPELQLLKARLVLAAGDLDAALELLKRGRELYPGYEALETSYGELLIISGKTQEGREILGGRLEVNPDSLVTLKPLLKDAVTREDWDLAADYSRRILALEENRDNLIQGADIALRRGDREEETRLISRLMDLYPGDPRGVCLYARYLLRLDRDAEARTWLEGALKLNLSSAEKSEIHYLLSLTYPDEENQIDQLRTALLENLENIPALLALSDIYIGRGDFRIAQRYLRQAVILDPENTTAQKALSDVERKLR
jgi:predicted Zn-dependent protease